MELVLPHEMAKVLAGGANGERSSRIGLEILLELARAATLRLTKMGVIATTWDFPQSQIENNAVGLAFKRRWGEYETKLHDVTS